MEVITQLIHQFLLDFRILYYPFANVAPFARAISSSGVVLQPSTSVLADVGFSYIATEDSPVEGIYTILTEDGDIIEQES